jgi:hypothetical protein
MFKTQQYEIMEGLIDAQTGQIYSFVDKVDYFTAQGSYPVSNDGKGTDGEVQVQSGWPMPFMQVKDVKGNNVVMTDTGGNFFSSDVSTAGLKGKCVLMNDWCGDATHSRWMATLIGVDTTMALTVRKGNAHQRKSAFTYSADMQASYLPLRLYTR